MGEFEDNMAFFRTVDAADLHFYYGVNCYQYARGWIKPALIVREEPRYWEITYLDVWPGLAAEKFSPDMSRPEHRALIMAGVEQDGGRKIDRPIQKAGYRTLSFFYSNDRRDFHFGRLDRDGRWRNKAPFTGIFEEAPDAPIDDGYDLVCFYLVPEAGGGAQEKHWREKADFFIEGDRCDLVGLNPEGRRGIQVCLSRRDGRAVGILGGKLVDVVRPELGLLPALLSGSVASRGSARG